jgi:hypothetical protein
MCSLELWKTGSTWQPDRGLCYQVYSFQKQADQFDVAIYLLLFCGETRELQANLAHK